VVQAARLLLLPAHRCTTPKQPDMASYVIFDPCRLVRQVKQFGS
jgi:hypothetical protein